TVPVRYPAERAFAAQVAAEFAEPVEAYPAWQAAVAAWRADGQPYPRAGALLRLAEAAAAAGERAAAADAVLEARGIAADLAAAGSPRSWTSRPRPRACTCRGSSPSWRSATAPKRRPSPATSACWRDRRRGQARSPARSRASASVSTWSRLQNAHRTSGRPAS